MAYLQKEFWNRAWDLYHFADEVVEMLYHKLSEAEACDWLKVDHSVI